MLEALVGKGLVVEEGGWLTVLTVFRAVETLHAGGSYVGERAPLNHRRSHEIRTRQKRR